MRKFKSLFVFAFGLFFGLSAFAQTEVYDEASFWAVQNNLGGSYIQTADITLTDAGSRTWQIGSTDQGAAFTGTYDGGGFTISVALSDGSNRNKGLFGENQGTITNLRLNGINVVADGGVSGEVKQVSVLCWKNKGTISNVYAENCAVRNSYVVSNRCGGIISALNESNITNCHASGCTVDIYGNAGGLVGTMTGGNVAYSSFQGDVTSLGTSGDGGIRTGNAGGIVGEISGGTISGCYVEEGSTVKLVGTMFGGRSGEGIAHGSGGTITNCYSGAQVVYEGSLEQCDNSPSNVTTPNSYPTVSSVLLSKEELSDFLNAGLEPPAFEIGPDGNIVFIDQTEFASELTTTQNGDFLSPETWGNKRFNNATATSVTIAHAVTLSGSVVIPSNIQLTVADGGSLTIKDGGSFVRGNAAVNNVTIEKNLSSLQWNFIGLANNGAISQLGAEGLPGMWALAFDYDNNKWYEDDFLHMDDNLARGNGIFVWTDSACTVYSVSATHTDGDLTVTNGVTGTTEAGRWMALANPYLGELDVTAFVDGNAIQGRTVYLYDGTSFNTEEAIPTTVPVGEGFFVNMAEGNDSITFQPSQMVGYPSAGAKAVAREKEYVKVSVSTDGYKVPVMICQNELAGQEYDIFDANKMFGDGSVAEPYFVTEGINLCKEEVATMPYYATMNIKSGEARTVEIVADAIPEGYSATLIDGDEEIELTEGMVYTTEISSGENAERFKLLIGEKNVSLEEAEATENLIQVSNVGRRVNISARGAIEAEVYNALGQKVYSTTDNNFTLDGVSAGAYIIKVSDGKSVKSEKIIVQ